MKEKNDILLNMLVKWYIKLSANLYDSKRSNINPKKIIDVVISLSYEIICSIIILQILNACETIPKSSKTGKKAKVMKPAKMFRESVKYLKYFGLTAFMDDNDIPENIISEFLDSLKKYKPISPLILNSFYEAVMGVRFVVKNKKLAFMFDNTRRKKQGIYYTPKEVTEWMVKRVFDDIKKSGLKSEPYYKILDPSCGGGIFLFECFSRLIKDIAPKKSRPVSSKIEQINLFGIYTPQTGTSLDTKKDILLKCIHGIDIDPKALQITKTVLLLKMLEGEKKCTLDKRFLKKFERNFEAGSFFEETTNLRLKEPLPKNNLNKLISSGFDIIIGNPPWVTIRKNEIGSEWDALRNRYKSVSVFKLNTFPIFIERTIELMRKDTTTAYIIPQRILDAPSYYHIRKELVMSTLISAIEVLNKNNFENVVADSIILFLNKKKKEFIPVTNYENNFSITAANKINYDEIEMDQFKINIYSRSEFNSVISKIDSRSKILKKYFTAHVGMMIRDKKERFTTPGNGSPIITSKCFSRYSQIKPRFIDLSKAVIFGGSKNSEKQNRAPKIILRKTGSEIISTIDFFGNVVEQSCYFILPQRELDIFFVSALLNSELINFYYRTNLISNPNSYPYIQHYDLEKIPLFCLELYPEKEKIAGSISELAKKIFSICGKPGNKKANSKNERISRSIEEEVNSLIYNLYDLNDSEIQSVKSYLKK